MSNTPNDRQPITLAEIQAQIKVPKSHHNEFGDFKFRSCADILNAAKKVLHPIGYWITLQDKLICKGDRYYIKAVATITNGEISYSSSGYAREQESKTKMDSMQITGSASSYARKYALEGLLAIDNNVDADSMDNRNESQPKNTAQKPLQQAGKNVATKATTTPQSKVATNDEPPMSFKKKFAGGTPGQISMLFDMLVLLEDKDLQEAEKEFAQRGRTRSAISDLINKYQQKVDKLKSLDPADIAYKKDFIKLLSNPVITQEERSRAIYNINKMSFSDLCSSTENLKQTIQERRATRLQPA